MLGRVAAASMPGPWLLPRVASRGHDAQRMQAVEPALDSLALSLLALVLQLGWAIRLLL